jgi:hypothetical protein
MKKLIIILVLACFSLAGYSQVSLFKPVPVDLFKSTGLKAGGSSAWLWRLSALVVAEELVYDKVTKQFNSKPLSSVGPAIGYRHFTPLSDGTPYNDFGVNLAVLLGADLNTITPASLKAALVINAFQFINVGGAYTLNATNHWSILLGASINF